jgi:hypothetical protein
VSATTALRITGEDLGDEEQRNRSVEGKRMGTIS